MLPDKYKYILERINEYSTRALASSLVHILCMHYQRSSSCGCDLITITRLPQTAHSVRLEWV